MTINRLLNPMLAFSLIPTKAKYCPRMFVKCSQNIFPVTAFQAILVFLPIFSGVEKPDAVFAQTTGKIQLAAYLIPPISIKHLQTLTDATGIQEFAHGTIPWKENGYCAEDVARALVAVTDYERVTGKTDARSLAKIYLRYLQSSLRGDGQLWNRQGRMLASGDSYGRVLWGLGYAAAMHSDKEIAAPAAKLFDQILPGCNEKLGGYPIANAYALEGLTAFVSKFPGGAPQAALEKCAKQNLDVYRQHRRGDWKWFDATMTYDTGRFPLAMLLAFDATTNAEYREAGLESLDFLLTVCFSPDGKQLRPIGNHGWYHEGGTPAQFDQQPIDAASIVEACVAAARITGEKKYAVSAGKAFEWFLGNNLKGMAVYDPDSGGCRDGLTVSGANVNEGGESTIMYVIARCNMEDLLNDHRFK
jgi:hypothetical protein